MRRELVTLQKRASQPHPISIRKIDEALPGIVAALVCRFLTAAAVRIDQAGEKRGGSAGARPLTNARNFAMGEGPGNRTASLTQEVARLEHGAVNCSKKRTSRPFACHQAADRTWAMASRGGPRPNELAPRGQVPRADG